MPAQSYFSQNVQSQIYQEFLQITNKKQRFKDVISLKKKEQSFKLKQSLP